MIEGNTIYIGPWSAKTTLTRTDKGTIAAETTVEGDLHKEPEVINREYSSLDALQRSINTETWHNSIQQLACKTAILLGTILLIHSFISDSFHLNAAIEASVGAAVAGIGKKFRGPLSYAELLIRSRDSASLRFPR